MLSLYEGSLEITLTVPFSSYRVYSPNSVYKIIPQSKVIMQGKLFQRFTHLLYCSVLSLSGNVNTRRMSKPDMGSIFHIKKSMKYSGHMKLLCELSKWSILNAFNPSRILNEHLCIYSSLQIPPRENWFQYVRRVYATAINFPCITTLNVSI